MSNEVINAVVVVDAEALRQAYPNGLSKSNTTNIDSYFKVLIDEAHQDGPNGIACTIGDTIYFNAIPKGNDADGVIISEFADRNAGLNANKLTDYISAPRFNTSYFDDYAYNNGSFPTHQIWNNWELWFAPLAALSGQKYSHMSVEALKSTLGLTDNRISYTLGFRISYPNKTLDFYFDPTIKITNS